MADYDTGYGYPYVIDQFTDENKVDISNKIYRKWADHFPLLSMIKKGPVNNYRFEVRLSNSIAQEYTSTSATSVATSITFTVDSACETYQVTSAVTSPTYLTAGTLLMSKDTQDVVRVTDNVESGSAATVTRIAGNNDVTTSDTWIRIGSAANEGADIGTVVTTRMDRDYNYTQIFRTEVGLTNTMRASDTNYGSELSRQQTDAALEHKTKLEKSLWFGRRYAATTGSAGLYTTRGLFEWIAGGVITTANSEDIAGVLTEANFDAALQSGMVRTNQPMSNWTFFGSSVVIGAINNFAKDRMLTTPGSMDNYGMEVTGYLTPWGHVNLVHEPFFNTTADRSGTYDIGTGLGVLVNLEQFELSHLRGRDTSVLTERQGRGEDLYKEELLTEAGVRMTGQDAGYIMYGITG